MEAYDFCVLIFDAFQLFGGTLEIIENTGVTALVTFTETDSVYATALFHADGAQVMTTTEDVDVFTASICFEEVSE